MYARIPEQCEEYLEGLVKDALGQEWQKRVGKVLKDAVDQVTFDIQDFIGAELIDRLNEDVRDTSRRAAEDFLRALAEGSEEQVRQFLMLPNDYWKQRDREHELASLYWGREHGPLALRRKMIEVVQDRLEREVLLDQEAEIQALRKKMEQQEIELRQWRSGERSAA